jgi:hypothetical protein
MPIRVPRGTRVVFAFPDNGYPYERKRAAYYLRVGQTYTVARTVVHDWRTDVHLVEVPDVAFNSVLFTEANP